MSLASILAVNWAPEIRGVIIVLIGTVSLMGSVYLILGTNLGARLGFLVTLTGFMSWMFIMGLIWWVYGIGLLGPSPSWEPAKPVTIVNDGDLVRAGILPENKLPVDDKTPVNGWIRLTDEDPRRGQAVASAEVLLVESGTLKVGEYQATAVYDLGGKRWPRLQIDLPGDHTADIDFLAFRHDPHYVLVEVQGLIPKLAEPGRAPAKPELDESRPKQYVMMVRDLGAKRRPAVTLTFGSGIILLILCWMLNRRDKTFRVHRSGGSIERASAGA